MKVEINHPHAAVIAAFYSGKRVRTVGGDWMSLGRNTPVFSSHFQYEIEPETVVKYAALVSSNGAGTIIASREVDDEGLLWREYRDSGCFRGVVKKTYIDGKLTSLDIIKDE